MKKLLKKDIQLMNSMNSNCKIYIQTNKFLEIKDIEMTYYAYIAQESQQFQEDLTQIFNLRAKTLMNDPQISMDKVKNENFTSKQYFGVHMRKEASQKYKLHMRTFQCRQPLVQKIRKEDKLFILNKWLILLLVFLALATPAGSLSVGSLLPTRYYQPSSIQIGTISVRPSDDIDPSTPFDSYFTITLQRLQLQNRNDYMVLASIKSLDLSIPGYIYRIHYPLTFTPTNFIIKFYVNDQVFLTSAKISYIVVSRTHQTLKQIFITYTTNALDPSPVCDGTNSLITCTSSQTLLITLQSVNYKPFVQLMVMTFTRNTNVALIPSYDINAGIVNTNTINFIFSVQYLKFYQFTMYVMFIRNDLFDNTQRKSIIFEYATYQHPPNTIATQIFQINFSVYASNMNVFVGFQGYTGKKMSFDLLANTPPNNAIKGTSNGIGSSLRVSALALYGYTDDCPSYLTMSCSSCPDYCKTCDVAPTFHCLQCNQGFTLSTDQQSCSCTSPLSIASYLCGDFPTGCNIATVLADNSLSCVACDLSKKLYLDGTVCQCKSGFVFDTNGICQDYCGDGVVIESECDDGNSLQGDGCSSACKVQAGFDCDFGVQPTVCESQIHLLYQIKDIYKIENENSVKLFLSNKNWQSLPFQIQKSNFKPQSTQISLKLILNQNTNETYIITDLQMVEMRQNYEIVLVFKYDFSVQGLKAYLTLNYQKTKYKNESQQLNFILEGENYALNYEKNVNSFKYLTYGIMASTILTLIGLFIGLLSPKFIGLESILTLQLIYYSQLLIKSISKWPPGFLFLKYLRLANGYNDVFQFTDYSVIHDKTRELHTLGVKKLIVQNFNINFMILLIVFCFLVVSFLLWRKKQRQILIHNERQNQLGVQIQKKMKEKRKKPDQSLKVYYKANQYGYFISNQISLWLIFPILAAICGYFIIPNNQFRFINNSQSNFITKMNVEITFFSLVVILIVCYNNFSNLWLSEISFRKFERKKQQMLYKKSLFVYIIVIGMMIFFMNGVTFSFIECSSIVLVVHCIYFMWLLRLNPYRQSLKIHYFGLIFNHSLYIVFLALINMINYLDQINEIILLILAYFITICCVVCILIAFVRLYYELKYGQQLQKQIQQEREKKQQQQKIKEKMKLKRKQTQLQNQANLRKSEKQKIREQNIYLYQNQLNEDNQLEYLDWLNGRIWDQKTKDNEYFKSHAEKPLKWLQTHQKEKYDQKIKQFEDLKSKSRHKQKLNEKINDQTYQATMKRLGRQLKELKQKSHPSKPKHQNQLLSY